MTFDSPAEGPRCDPGPPDQVVPRPPERDGRVEVVVAANEVLHVSGLGVDDLVGRIERGHQGHTDVVVRCATPGVEGVPTAASPDLHALSEREIEILRLIASGLTNQAITAELFLGINTVKTYIRTAYRKMGVTSRSQAVLWTIRHGLGPDTPRRTTAASSSGDES